MALKIREERLIQECSELQNLAQASGWIKDPVFSKNGEGLLAWSFTLVVCERQIPLHLVFPAMFPELPPFVIPSDDEVRLSQHQYGEGGELCLQYRPDNWHPDCKSTDVVRSAYALLQATTEDSSYSEVESDHPQDLPSLIAGVSFRFLLPFDTAHLLRRQLAGHVRELDFSLEWRAGATEVLVARVARIRWQTEECLVAGGPGLAGRLVPGLLYRLPSIRDIPDAPPEELGTLVFQQLPVWLRDWVSKRRDNLIVVSNGKQEVLIRVRGKGPEQKIAAFLTIYPPQAKERRTHGKAFYRSSVCVIGAGSLGSKVAATLAREGVGNFMLLDNDVLWSDNLVRNELDELDVGHHKADALKTRLHRIMPSVRVGALEMSLTSQSSVQAIARLNEIIGSCDLVIDTTADSGVFRMAAAVCTQKQKPLVWGRVYAGGIGGVIARSVPQEDPPPMVAASQLRAWCDANDQSPPIGRERDYGLESDDMDEPLFASDSDVAIIANRLVRHALDALSSAEARVHPEPAYFIGLRRGWIFEHPFDTHPVAYAASEGWESGTEIFDTNSLDRVLKHLEAHCDA